MSQESKNSQGLLGDSDNIPRRSKLRLRVKLFFSIGHVLNDLTATIWFTYMLIFLRKVAGLGSVMAGNLILLGQVADAIFNPIVGVLSSNEICSCLLRLNRRGIWHVLGTILVCSTFMVIFVTCGGCTMALPYWARVLFYGVIITLFQFGWASTQLSHLSLLTDLTSSTDEITELNSLRYGWTVLSQIVVYSVVSILFGERGYASESVGQQDAVTFMTLGFTVVGIGIFFNIIFYIGMRQELFGSYTYLYDADLYDNSSNSISTMHPKTSWIQWLKRPTLYVVALSYISARVIISLTQVYVPFFVTETLGLRKISIALYPLVTCLSGLTITIFLKTIAKQCPKGPLYFWGCLNVIGASIWIYFLAPQASYSVFGTAVLSGVGSATIIVIATAFISDMVRNEPESGPYVFGLMGFAEKLFNGVLIFAIQAVNPCGLTADAPVCGYFNRAVLALVPGVAALISILSQLLSLKMKCT